MAKSRTFFRSFGPLSILVLASLAACQGGSQKDPECFESASCGDGKECSGGICVGVTACVEKTDCPATSQCVAGVCRATCTSDAECGALRCDTSLGTCTPKENPTPSTGGTSSGGAASGGASSGGTGTGGVLASGGSGGVPTTDVDVIDDLEDGDVKILPTDSRVGSWYSYNEDSARPQLSAPAASDSGKAIHATGSHKGGVALDAAYGGIGVDLKNANSDGQGPRSTSRLAYDASDWDGIQFRIKTVGSTKSIRFEIVTTAIATQEERGTCTGDGCFDAYGMDIPLETQWTLVKVPFSSVVQEGWGKKVTFDPATILGVAFEDLTTNNWDFWVDDLAFYKEPPELGGTGGTGGGAGTGGAGTGGGSSGECGDSWGAQSDGSVTWYTFSQGTAAIGDVNCSYGITTGNPDKAGHVTTGSGTYFGAINTADYNTAAACGACAEVSRDNGKKVTVTIIDQCPIDTNPKCVKGHIDLSKAAFLQLGEESEGYLGARAGRGKITWKYVPCPTTEKVSFQLKEPSNQYWNMVLVEGHIYPIASVQIQVGSEWRNASRSMYNYWLPPGGVMGSSPYKIRATDINGSVIEGTASLSSGEQSTGKQFTCQ